MSHSLLILELLKKNKTKKNQKKTTTTTTRKNNKFNWLDFFSHTYISLVGHIEICQGPKPHKEFLWFLLATQGLIVMKIYLFERWPTD